MWAEMTRKIVAASVLFMLPALSARAEPPAGSAAPSPARVLVLRNGHVLQGAITRVGDLYHVVVPGGEIRVKPARVEFCCATLEEAYWRKRALIRPGNAEDHLELAKWCQRHAQHGFAVRELADAKAADPTNPRIPHLERQLKMSLPSNRTTRSTPPRQRGPTDEQLERLVRDMPPGVVERFADTIQPVLLNNCTKSGCHGPHCKSEHHLFRGHSGRPPTRRLTLRNLHATLQWVDRDEPAASPLLTVPLGPHGTVKNKIFDKGQMDQYRRMVDWVARLSRAKRCEELDAETPPAEAAPASPPDSAPDDPPPDAEPAQPASNVRRGQPPPQFVPVDPFDPEIFNRRFFGEE
jgi:hypothetical protein